MLGLVPLGDVLNAADDSPRPAVGSLDHGLAGAKMAHHAIRAHDPKVEWPQLCPLD